MILDVKFEELSNVIDADFEMGNTKLSLDLDPTSAFAADLLKKVIADNDETEAAIAAKVEEVKTAAETVVEAAEEVKTTAAEMFTECANALKATASGEIVRVDDVSPIEHKAKAKVSGKNLIPYPYMGGNATSYGITFTDNGDGTITANGTATDHANYFCAWYPSLIPIKAGIYTISGCPEGGGATTYEFVVGWRKTPTGTRQLHYEQGKGLTIELTEDGYIDVICVVRNGATANNIIFKPQIEEGDTATEYEPYIDPATVTLTRCGKNICDISNVGLVTVNAAGAQRAGIILDKPASYTFSCVASSDTSLAYKVVANGEYGDYYTFSGRIKFTVSIGENQKLIIYKGAEDAFAFGLTNAQLEIGTEATEYEPYNGETYTPAADGTVEMASISPCMTLLTDSNVNIEVEYNQDTNAAMGDVRADLQQLDNVTATLTGEIGGIDAALDAIIAIQNTLIGGAE